MRRDDGSPVGTPVGTPVVGPACGPVPRPAAGLAKQWLDAHVPLTLVMDLSMPFGPHSTELLAAEPAPGTPSWNLSAGPSPAPAQPAARVVGQVSARPATHLAHPSHRRPTAALGSGGDTDFTAPASPC